MKYSFLLLGILSINILFGQNLYPEKFDECNLNKFCLDCGDIKAQPPQTFINDLISNLNERSINKINGDIEVQILIDSLGTPCLLSAKNETNIKSKKLNLKNGINSTKKWSPAMSKGKSQQVSVSLLLTFSKGTVSVQRKMFGLTQNTNFKPDDTPDVNKSKDSGLSESWTLFNRENSDLPWNTSRGVTVDSNNILWIATDNGVVKMENGKMEVFNVHNSSIKSEKYNKSETASVREISIDRDNNIWLIANWDVYKFDGENWNIYDSLNSPIVWARRIFVDNSKNVSTEITRHNLIGQQVSKDYIGIVIITFSDGSAIKTYQNK